MDLDESDFVPIITNNISSCEQKYYNKCCVSNFVLLFKMTNFTIFCKEINWTLLYFMCFIYIYIYIYIFKEIVILIRTYKHESNI